MDKQFELKEGKIQYFMNRIWTLKFGEFWGLVLEKTLNSRYSIHLGSDKAYLDLKKLYW